MEKKFKISDKTTVAKIVYAAVVAILCVSAIVVGIIAAASRKEEIPEDDTHAGELTPPDDSQNPGNEAPEDEKKPTVFISPVVGDVVKFHSLDTPVYSDTLGEWRVHAGIDILTPEGAAVYSSSDGTVTKVFDDVRLGRTVEITHEGGIVTCYSNLAKDSTTPSVGATVSSGERIGTVGDSALSELADEAHLHFELKVNGASVNPLDYFSEEAKSASLGITEA